MLTGEIMGTVGAVAGTALNLFGGARAARRKRRILAEQERKNESWFNQEYYANPLERASWQASVAGMLEGHNRRMAAARGASAVSGASAGSVLAEKSSANESMGQGMRQQAANSEQYAQAERNRYMSRDAELANQNIDAENKWQDSLSNAAKSASSVAAGSFT